MFERRKIMTKKQNYIWRNDRNFALDEYEKQQYYYVAEANDLITKARHDLTARELKIMDFIISKLKPFFKSNLLCFKTSNSQFTVPKAKTPIFKLFCPYKLINVKHKININLYFICNPFLFNKRIVYELYSPNIAFLK